jgi:hypothetical protein
MKLRWKKKAEENATFCLIKDGIIFFPLILSNELGKGLTINPENETRP